MNADTSQKPGRNLRGSRVDLWAPSGLLVLIAAAQILMTQLSELSPWKGGGFGMFASTDAPSLRIIHAEAVDESGEIIPIDVADGIDEEHWDSIRALPREVDLVRLGRSLLGERFLPQGDGLRRDFELIRKENPAIRLPPQTDSQDMPFFRVAGESEGERAPPERRARRIRSIKLQWKKLEFTHQGAMLRTAILGPAVVIGEPWPGAGRGGENGPPETEPHEEEQP